MSLSTSDDANIFTVSPVRSHESVQGNREFTRYLTATLCIPNIRIITFADDAVIYFARVQKAGGKIINQ